MNVGTVNRPKLLLVKYMAIESWQLKFRQFDRFQPIATVGIVGCIEVTMSTSTGRRLIVFRETSAAVWSSCRWVSG